MARKNPTLVGIVAVCNSRHLSDDSGTPAEFQKDGAERLVALCSLLERLLRLHKQFGWWDEYVKYACHGAIAISRDIFLSSSLETAADVLLYLLGACRKLTLGAEISPSDARRDLERAIRKRRQEPLENVVRMLFEGPISPPYGYARKNLTRRGMDLEAMTPLARDVTQRADEIPFASLAHAIAHELHCTITLCPFEAIRADGQNRAIRYPVKNNSQIEHIIFYAPPLGNSADEVSRTRLAVAHELAHILLAHQPGWRQNRKHEVEANFLATLFVVLRGSPIQRAKSLPSHIDKILNMCNLGDSERALLRPRLEAVITGSLIDSGGRFTIPLPCILPRDSGDIKRFMDDLEATQADVALRRRINNAVSETIAHLLTPSRN